MRTNIFRGLLVLGVVLSLAVVASPVMPALARDPASLDPDPADHRIHQASRDRETTGTEKVLIPSATADTIVSLYIVDGSESPALTSWGTPNGTFAGAQRGTGDGKSMEVFVPVSAESSGPKALVSNILQWTETGGFSLLDSIIMTPNPS